MRHRSVDLEKDRFSATHLSNPAVRPFPTVNLSFPFV